MAYEEAIAGEVEHMLKFLSVCGLTDDELKAVATNHLKPITTLTVRMTAAAMEKAAHELLAEL